MQRFVNAADGLKAVLNPRCDPQSDACAPEPWNQRNFRS